MVRVRDMIVSATYSRYDLFTSYFGLVIVFRFFGSNADAIGGTTLVTSLRVGSVFAVYSRVVRYWCRRWAGYGDGHCSGGHVASFVYFRASVYGFFCGNADIVFGEPYRVVTSLACGLSILGASGSVYGSNGLVIVYGRCGHLIGLVANPFSRSRGVYANFEIGIAYEFVN